MQRDIAWLWLIPFLPLLGAALNGLLGRRLGKGFVSLVATVLPGAAFIVSLALFAGLLLEDRAILVRANPGDLMLAESALQSGAGVDQDRRWVVDLELPPAELPRDGRASPAEHAWAGAVLRVSPPPARNLLFEMAGLLATPALDEEAVREAVATAGLQVRPAGATGPLESGQAEVGWAGEVAPRSYGCTLGTWIQVGQFQIEWALLVDRLSVILLLVITGVGTLIHVYSTSYMEGEDPGGFARYFCYLNLFVAMMLVLVLGRDLFVLFIGWEGVGLCSYLLIGFHYQDRDNAACGSKAFIVNRIGDLGFVLGMFGLLVLVRQVTAPGESFGLDMVRLNQLFRDGAIHAAPDAAYWRGLACLLLFVGATGKSAQIPLQLWLPDAMAGPTPVSALIHAATMVTAGVYMIARLSFVYGPSPLVPGDVGAVVAGIPVLSIIALVGVLTAFYAATSALGQDDIKRVLAYSTISQLGYMFVGVGAMAFGGAVFHLVTHAFFKALLFLGAGSVIHACHTQSMRQMGGLREYMPTTSLTMIVGALALAGVFPLAGFFSKDLILYEVLVRGNVENSFRGAWMAIYFLGAVTAALTAVYTMRMIGLTFLGSYRGSGHPHESPRAMTGPLVALAVLTALAGLLGVPHVWAHLRWDLPEFLGAVVARSPSAGAALGALADSARLEQVQHDLHYLEWWGLGVGLALAFLFAGFGWWQWRGDPARIGWENPAGALRRLRDFLANAWYYDESVNKRLAQPVAKETATALWRWVDDETVDRQLVDGTGRVGLELSNLARAAQTGRLSSYAAYLILGAVGIGLLAIFVNPLLQALLGQTTGH